MASFDTSHRVPISVP